MSAPPRPTIAELLVRYELEPSLKDYYVEGCFDRDLLAHLAKKIGSRDIVFYEIDAIDVPAERLLAHGLTDGNKQRVIALARDLSVVGAKGKYRCIVDRDLDHWLGQLEDTPRLLFTRFCDVESYFLLEPLVAHFLVTVAKCRIPDWREFYSSFLIALREMYALRLTDRRLGWNLSWISIEKGFQVGGNSKIKFDMADYLPKLLAKNGKTKEVEYFMRDHTSACNLLNGDPRLYVRGHDLVDLLAWVVDKFKGVKAFSGAQAIERLFFTATDQADELSELVAEG